MNTFFLQKRLEIYLYKFSDLNPIFRLIHSFTGDEGDRNKKRTGRNTDPSCVVAGTGLEPATFGL